MIYAECVNIDKTVSRIEICEKTEGDIKKIVLKREDVPRNTDYVKIISEEFFADVGADGYYVVSRGGPYVKSSYMMCSFKERGDTEFTVTDCALPVFGMKKGDACFIAIVTGMRFEFDTVVGVKNGKYYLYPMFSLEGDEPYEDIGIEIHYITEGDKDYSAMAREYRNYKLSKGDCVPLKVRMENNPYLEYAAKAPNVRIRLGMKPLPTPVPEQTLQNEPEMVTCCTFDRMKELIDEFLRQGINAAEFCLIGWNLKGHDGRYPQMFPVEPELGGEAKLRELIKYGQEKGFQMTCHTNSSDAYSISDMWNREDILVLKDGSISVDPNAWSGGRMYQLCPVVGAKHAEEMFPKIADLGFRGIHYVDVISLHPPRKCYSEKHPLNKLEAVEYNNKIMNLSKNLIGGFSSEGAYDTNIGNLDFALLVHSNTMGEQPEICDRVIPFWELVYHGITLHNTSWETGSAAASQDINKKAVLKNIEFGGRPLFYFHHGFLGHVEQRGTGLNTETDESMKSSVSRVKKALGDFDKFAYLQTELMEKHSEIAEGVFETVYSDGTKVIVDYNNLSYEIIE